MTMTENEELARRGYDALMRGEFEALEEVMAPDLTWHWWERGPWDCHSRDEALAVIKERLGQNSIGELREVTDLGEGRVLVVTGLRPDSEIGPEELGLPAGHDETANVVTIRDGKVVAMQDYRSRAEATEAAQGAGGSG
jgi:ketosteroid isomerase-like protein